MPLIRREAPKSPAPPLDATRLVATLSEGTVDERWAAARAAAELPDGLSILRDALPRENSPRIREAIFTGLARIGTPESASAVLPYLGSDDASVRAGTLDALRAMPDATAPHLARLLEDNDPDVRLLACELARNQPAADAGRLLGELLRSESHANVCAAAIEVLAEIGGPDSLPVLAECAARFPNDPFLAFAVQIANERIGSQASNRG
jgi:HEAT repeat protein